MRAFQIKIDQSPLAFTLFPRRVLTFVPRQVEFFHIQLSTLRNMPPAKTLMDFFSMPKAKRPKTTSFTSPGSEKPGSTARQAIGSASSSFSNSQDDGLRGSTAALTLSSDSVDFGEGDQRCVLLEELLVEKTWLDALPRELQKPYAKNLCKFVEKEICIDNTQIYPPSHLIFNALNSTPFDKVKVVILGQDPYHGPGQAMGLSFSVPEGVKIPSSLVNIFKEIKNDLGCAIPSHGNLEKWALQGVLLLNTVLTVRSHQANSHAKKGWEQFTDAVIQNISLKKSGVVFLLWGNSAQTKSRLIDTSKHHILKAAHPSGLSANRGFFGCRHFSSTNKILEKGGEVPIDWQL